MKSTDSGETNKKIIPVYGIQIIRFWGKNELTLQQFMLDNGLHAYEPGKISPLLKDELQNYPTEKIPYLIFDKQELSKYQAFTRSILPRIDNLPVLKNIDKEKTALFLKINELRYKNKMNRFDQTVSKELEERIFEYYKKYKKGFSGTIDDDDWFWQISHDFPPPIERDENIENATWDEHIKPIVELYNLEDPIDKQFEYKHFNIPETITEIEVNSMMRETMALCYELPSDDFYKEVMQELAKGKTGVTVPMTKEETEVTGEKEKKVDIKNEFHKFLFRLFKENRLSYFLELLHREPRSLKSAKSEQDRDVFIEKKVFPCQPGTKWDDVKITLTGDDTVRVKTPQGEGVFSYHQLELADRRIPKGKATILWILLKLFVKNNGFISPNTDDYISNLSDTAKRLNKHLQKLFGIKESIYTDHYKKLKKLDIDPEIYTAQDEQTATKSQRVKGYRTKIFFSNQTKMVF